MWKNMIFWLWEVQKGTSSLHREMERPSEQVAWGEEKLAITNLEFFLLIYSSKFGTRVICVGRVPNKREATDNRDCNRWPPHNKYFIPIVQSP
jgi:hypothetical protein